MPNRRAFYTAALLALVVLFAAGCSAVAGPSALTSAGSKSGSTQALAYQTISGSVERGVTVVGLGKAFGTPDVAYVTVGVETQDQSIQQAVADNNARMTQLLDALKGLGIAEKDIRTSNYSVYTERPPVLDTEGKGGEGPLTYHVSNQVAVTVRDANKLGDVLDKAVEAGANSIYGVYFGVADTSKLEAEARANAVTDARSRAENLAKLANVNLGEVLSISEVISSAGPVFERAVALQAAPSAPIQPGELEVQVSVQVTYAIQ